MNFGKKDQKYFIELSNGEKIEQKCAEHCMCIECCDDRREVNLKIVELKKEGIYAVYFPKIKQCVFGSDFLKRNKDWVENMGVKSEQITKLCDEILMQLKGLNKNDI